jgi:hypothetical protein
MPAPGVPIPTPTVPTWAVPASDSRVGLTPTPTPLPRASRPALPFGKTSPKTPAPITAETAAPTQPVPRTPITVETAVPPPPAQPPLPAQPLATGSFEPVVVPSRGVDLIVVPPGAMFKDTRPEVTDPIKPVRKLRPRSQLKATQRTRPEPRPAARLVPAKGSGPRSASAADGRRPELEARRGSDKRLSVVWLILVIFALGAGAMVTAYYWPDL